MRALRTVTVLAVLAAIGWGGYWFVGARALERVLAEGLARLPQVSVEGHSIRGFPNRFDITFDAPRIAVDGAEWSAPFVQVFALSYRLNHLIAVFAHDQVLRIGAREALVHSDDLRASVVMEAGLDLPLTEVVVAGRALDLRIDGARLRMDALRLASRRTGATRHDLVLLAEGLFPDATALAQIDPGNHWPRAFGVVRLDAEVETDRPLDRHALQGQAPQVVRLTLTGAHLSWDGTDITLTGRLTPDSAGVLSGEVVLQVVGWDALMARGRAAGLLQDGGQGFLGPLLDALSSQVQGDRIEVPMAVVAGDVRIGPLLLGTLPPLR